MPKDEKSLDELMTPEEREFVEKWRKTIGKIHIAPNDQEAMANDRCIYFWGLGKDATWTFIKRWAAINEDWNAMWFDEEYAKKSRYGGIIAPPLYLISVHDGLAAPMDVLNSITLPTRCHCMRPDLEKYPTLGAAGGQAETIWEFFEPVRPGDTIYAEHKLADMSWHKAREVEGRPFSRFLYVTGETTFTNQKGQLVGHVTSTGIGAAK
jgi:acyl dehydratase